MPSPKASNTNLVNVSQSKKGNGIPLRRGPKGYFQGTRKEFLETQLPAYVTAGKGRRQTFWHNFWSAWWLRYPWQLGDDEEPPKDDADKMARLASVAPGDAECKSEVERKLRERLSQWFSNRASADNGTRRDTLAWLPLLQRLHHIRSPSPRKRTAVQQFMLDYPEVVNTAFNHQYADGLKLSSVQQMNMRNNVAKLLLARKYSHLTAELEKRAIEQRDADIDEWNLVLDDISFAEDVPQARDNLFDAVHPLLQAIGSYANCYVSLIVGNAGTVEKDGEFFTAVHWWPGDRKSTKNWTQWDEEAFNAGVAGPFLAYAKETNRKLKIRQDQVAQPLRVPSSTIQPIAGSVDSSTQSADPSPTHMKSTPTTTALRATYRSLPDRGKSSTPAPHTGKRKHATTRPIRYFEDTPSEDDNTDDGHGGNGTSSSEFLSFKRPRTSRIIESSARPPTLDVGIQDTSNSSSPAPVEIRSPSDVPRTRTDLPTDREGATATPTPSAILRPPHSLADSTDVSPSDREVPEVSSTEVGSMFGEVEATPAAIAEISTAEPELVDEPAPIMETPIIPAASCPIDVENVPAFLRSHGKGNRRVDIFEYLNKLQDPHFQQVLFHYVEFENSSKSNTNGSLPTVGRPPEISQWTSRARPANLPDYKKGERTFRMFVDSVLGWWGVIQPPWRSFKRDTVSREVLGDWEVLRAPRINGLLNVVILVYWWGRILQEHGPEDDVRADYEFFANDVAWVISRLST